MQSYVYYDNKLKLIVYFCVSIYPLWMLGKVTYQLLQKTAALSSPMATSKFLFKKVCSFCSRLFEAQKITTKYCSHACNLKHYKKKKRLQKIAADSPQYGAAVLSKVRLGQGAFRVLVTDAYQRRCAITGEKTLPVLEAAHIKSYAKSGPHALSNGLLLRSDMHKLFDAGYLTITQEHKIEVSSKIKEEFQNGREYYQYHGQSLLYLPADLGKRPGTQYIQWHNENVYRS